MKQNIQNVVSFIQSHYPQLEGHIRGEQYPPPRYVIVLSQFIGFFQISMLICCFTGFGFLASFGLPAEVVQWMDDNKATFALMPFVLNMFVGSLANTGAFEIYVNDVLEFSKLETGRFPLRKEIVKIFKKYGL